MSIDLSNLFFENENIHYFKGEIIASDTNLDLNEFRILDPIKYKGEICKVNAEYIINIYVCYIFETNCNRCLIHTVKDMESFLSARLENYKQKPKEDEDIDIIYYNGDTLDIEEYVLMEVISSLPMKTLCKEDCKGLCSRCGNDLNKKTCSCILENVDPRFEKLKGFFDKN